ncbi:arginase family protein [Oleiagrimonas sp. C23AA]|uniref:arginase family protein n=1 Tax=Oleiagrimonas sp. C23AA TaxID=2719047 RepID=UPI001423B98D|nr:arginase family protein [Oleiagrimonas sp. C23AA]NII11123.1 arginase family protein [Oleiagrimonas sp. C23AA]
MQPIVLDVDDSVGAIRHRLVVPLQHWGQHLRFACSRRMLGRFGGVLDKTMPTDHGLVFMGSGDFHHLSLPLIERASARHGALDVVVFDNHPDNMRFPFGVHCGSWVSRVANLPGVRHVHVVGITSSDIALAHAWENRLAPLYRRQLTYWSVGVDVRWARAGRLQHAFRNFAGTADMLRALQDHLATHAQSVPIYLSIDKDVLCAEDARTNWDQGVMRADELLAAIAGMHGRIVSADITGEVSTAHYHQWWKRAMASLDHQPEVPASELERWRHQHHALNQRLLDAIHGAWQTRPADSGTG